MNTPADKVARIREQLVNQAARSERPTLVETGIYNGHGSGIDAIVYRAKFVPTVFAARQFVNHGHVKVNGKRVTIPSYRVKVGDVVEIKEKSKQMNLVLEAQALAERDVPDYIEVDTTNMTAKLSRIPVITDVPYPVQMEPHLVVEYYSR